MQGLMFMKKASSSQESLEDHRQEGQLLNHQNGGAHK